MYLLKKILWFVALLLSSLISFAQPANTNISNGVLFDGEPYLAVNPTNNQNLVAAWMALQFSGGFHITIKTRASFDGGNTWSTANLLPHFGTGYGSADVSMAFDRNGLLYICYIDYRQSPDSGGIYVARSVDGGLNWDVPSKAFDMYDDANKRPIDRPWLVVDNSVTINSGTLYITTKPAPWIAPPNRNYFKVSTDFGHTWTTIANVDGGNHLVGNVVAAPMASPATTVNGNFCAVYPSYLASQNPLPAFYFASSNDQGQSFNYTTVFAGIPAANDTNLKNGYLLISHPTDSNKLLFLSPEAQNGDADIFAYQSSDGGQNWSSPIRVNDDSLANGKSQDMVWASYNDSGNVAVTWRDRRNSPVNGFWNAGYDFYYSLSSDNGQTFLANQKLSNQFIQFDSVIAQNGNDFMSCAYRGDTLYTVWGDNRSGKMNIYFVKTQASTNTNLGISLLEGGESRLRVFPNPAKEETNVFVPDKMIGKVLLVYDILGNKIFETHVKNNFINLNNKNLISGSYIIKIENESLHFIIEK